MSIGILAFGSLIDDPGTELTGAAIDRKSVETPFSVEFAHSSITRDGAPTLVPVSDRGLPVPAVLLVLDDWVTEPAARVMLYRRETGRDIGPDAVSRVDWIAKLENFEGINTCLYAAFPADIWPLDADKLADLAIQSATARAGAYRRDGISYLQQQKSRGISTPLMPGYENALLARTGAPDLAGAWEYSRSGTVAAKPDPAQTDTLATEADGIKPGAASADTTAAQSDGAGAHDDAAPGKSKRDQKPMESGAGDGNRWLVPSWVASVKSTADRLAGELDQTGCADPPSDYATIHQIVEEAIKRARRHAQRHCLIVRNRPFRRLRSLGRRIADWWTGGEVNQAWAELHIASQALLTIQAPSVVKSQLADMAAAVVTALNPEDVRRKDYLKTLELLAPAPRGISPADRAQLRAIRQACDSSSDGGHADARAFRNTLILASSLLAGVLGAVAIIAGLDPGFRTAFASAPSHPGGWYVLELEVIASLSGLTGAVLALRSYTGFQYSYGLPLVQAYLKGGTGAATGLIGVLLARAGITGSLTLKPGASTFVVAVVFGYAQYLFTRLVDQQANAVLKAAGSRSDPGITPAVPAGSALPALLTTSTAPGPQVPGEFPDKGEEIGFRHSDHRDEPSRKRH